MAKAKRAVTDLLRLQVAARDGIQCQYCGDGYATDYHVDHVVPVSLGGPTLLHNLVLACHSCNERKKDRVWVPRNLAAITGEKPDWFAYVSALAADLDMARLGRTAHRPATPPIVREGAPLAVIEERVIDFYGDVVTVLRTADGGLYAALRPIITGLGLDWSRQCLRLKRDPLLLDAARFITVATSEGYPRPMVCLPFDLVPGWLFGISAERLDATAQARLALYRRRCFDLLGQAVRADLSV